MWPFVNSILHECLDTFAPICSVQCKKSHHPTPSLLSVIKQKKQAKTKANRIKSDEDVLPYKHLKNYLNILVGRPK